MTAADAPSPPTPDRDVRPDYLKAAAILAVVGIHAGVPGTSVMRFCVPTFIAVWAYFTELGFARRTPAERLTYLGQRFARLFLIYAFWTAVYLGVALLYDKWTSQPLSTIVGRYLGGDGFNGQYFFVVLLQLTLLFPLVRLAVRPTTALPLVAAGMVFNIAMLYAAFHNGLVWRLMDRPFVYWLPYAVLGIAFAHGWLRRRPWLLAVGVACLAMSPIEAAWLARHFAHWSGYLPATVVAGSVCLLLATMPAAAPIDSSDCRRVEWLLYVGRHSLGIFVIHGLALLAIGQTPLRQHGDFAADAVRSIARVVIAVGFSLTVTTGLQRAGLGALVGTARRRTEP